jgi:prefoldin subunit 5
MGYKSSFDAESALLKLEPDLRSAVALAGTLEQAMNEVRRKLLDLEINKNDLRESLRKARENVRRIESELRQTKTEFWRLKHENL